MLVSSLKYIRFGYSLYNFCVLVKIILVISDKGWTKYVQFRVIV